MTRALAPAAESAAPRAVIVGGLDQTDDPEIGGRGTSAAFVLDSIDEVERFLDTLTR